MINLVRVITLFLLSSVLCQCSLSPVASPKMVTYTLKPIAVESPKHKHTQKSLLVATPDSEPGYDTNRIAYREHENQISYYAQHQWVASPGRMLSPLLVQAIENTGYYRSIVSAPFSGITTTRLNVRVLYWLQDMEAGHNEMRLSVRVSLLNVNKAKLISAKTIEVIEPILSKRPEAVADATNRATGKLLAKIARFSQQ